MTFVLVYACSLFFIFTRRLGLSLELGQVRGGRVSFERGSTCVFRYRHCFLASVLRRKPHNVFRPLPYSRAWSVQQVVWEVPPPIVEYLTSDMH